MESEEFERLVTNEWRRKEHMETFIEPNRRFYELLENHAIGLHTGVANLAEKKKSMLNQLKMQLNKLQINGGSPIREGYNKCLEGAERIVEIDNEFVTLFEISRRKQWKIYRWE
eukprot:TRINITY_DN4952_c0_g5_i1.p2 TRINITY_DN4952_c0_g5~~TRINITY_DN4952_c0_g5_i1.p2  ORF type:complete len:114 (-),score=23.09 TRINITY_DN4952_c0_g5_i1:392-733(-)